MNHISKVNQILFIRTSREDKDYIEFSFHDDQRNNQLQRILVYVDPETKYSIGSLVEEIEKEDSDTYGSESIHKQGYTRILVTLSSDLESNKTVCDILTFFYDKNSQLDKRWTFDTEKD